MNGDVFANRWLGKLTKLNPASGRGACAGKAPHKPLLLRCLLDMAENDELTGRAFTRSPGLVLRFRSYGSLVSERWPTRLDLRLPFYHLSTQEFWAALDAEMRPASSPDTCVVCELHSEFFDLLADSSFRFIARVVSITKFFDLTEQISLLESLGIEGTVPARNKSVRGMEETEAAAKRKGRCARFAVRVCSEYRYTCALTGYRCVTGEGATIVDAAHIEQWAITQNDEPTNGLALCKNAHWMFDNGIWSADDEMRIVVHTPSFTENGPESLRISTLAGRHLQFDPSSKLRPSLELLRRHRQYHGIK
jgi:putative restriction endonuclease